MLGCSLVCDCVQDLRQVLDISGGVTDSIFPEVEQWLDSCDNMRCLKFVATRRTMNKFRSITDVVFCASHPTYLDLCLKFYNGNGVALRYIIDMDERQIMENEMLNMLDEAWISFKNKTPYYYVPTVYTPRSTSVIEMMCNIA